MIKQMKYISFFLFLLTQQISVFGQTSDSIENFIIKYNLLNFTDTNSIKPLTIFLYPNGNFFLKNGYIKQPEKEQIIHYHFNKKGKQIKQCLEKYIKVTDNSNIIDIKNYFPKQYNSLDSGYLTYYIINFSVLLQGFNEPLLYKMKDTNVFRIVSHCYNYLEDSDNKHYQKYNLIRVHFDKNMLVFKTGHFNQNLNFIIDYENTYHLNKKDIKRLKKSYIAIDFTDDNIYYKKACYEQRLFEFKNNDKYYMFLRADLYVNKLENVSYFTGLYYLLCNILEKNLYKPIYKCK